VARHLHFWIRSLAAARDVKKGKSLVLTSVTEEVTCVCVCALCSMRRPPVALPFRCVTPVVRNERTNERVSNNPKAAKRGQHILLLLLPYCLCVYGCLCVLAGYSECNKHSTAQQSTTDAKDCTFLAIRTDFHSRGGLFRSSSRRLLLLLRARTTCTCTCSPDPDCLNDNYTYTQHPASQRAAAACSNSTSF